MKRIERMQENGRRLEGQFIIGIDPAKSKHQAVLLTPEGTTTGRSFSFPTSHTGFSETLSRRIEERNHDNSQVVYAIEVSCSLWQNLAYYLQAQGKAVVLVSPLATYHARASMTGDFSRTDTKDAELIARLARQGSYRDMPEHTDQERALHRLGISTSSAKACSATTSACAASSSAPSPSSSTCSRSRRRAPATCSGRRSHRSSSWPLSRCCPVSPRAISMDARRS